MTTFGILSLLAGPSSLADGGWHWSLVGRPYRAGRRLVSSGRQSLAGQRHQTDCPSRCRFGRSGNALMWVNLDGRKLGGTKIRGWNGGIVLARDIGSRGNPDHVAYTVFVDNPSRDFGVKTRAGWKSTSLRKQDWNRWPKLQAAFKSMTRFVNWSVWPPIMDCSCCPIRPRMNSSPSMFAAPANHPSLRSKLKTLAASPLSLMANCLLPRTAPSSDIRLRMTGSPSAFREEILLCLPQIFKRPNRSSSRTGKFM